MPLAIFDIDGTLTRTTALDDNCYVRAIEAGLGVSGFDTDWANYAHATDSGLLEEIARRTLGRGPTPEEWLRVRRVFLELLAVAAGRAGAVTQVAGAGALLQLLAARGWGVALATGAWRPSATIKLSTAGLAWEGLPLATADDHAERAEIVKRAAARASEKEVGPVARPDPEEAMRIAPARWGTGCGTCARRGRWGWASWAWRRALGGRAWSPRAPRRSSRTSRTRWARTRRCGARRGSDQAATPTPRSVMTRRTAAS